jgi:hypothetical protein
VVPDAEQQGPHHRPGQRAERGLLLAGCVAVAHVGEHPVELLAQPGRQRITDFLLGQRAPCRDGLARLARRPRR